MAILELIRFSGAHADMQKMVDEFTGSGSLKKVSEEKGCVYYRFYFSAEDDDCLLLTEKWEDRAALDAHHGTPMMAEQLDLIKKYGLKLEVESYEL
jgi:quinol monooxygenase YgiN